MKLGIVITQNDAEAVFNALRFANFAVGKGDDVRVFLLGAGVDIEKIDDVRFDVRGQAETLLGNGGRIQACGTCLKLRESGGSEVCPLSTMNDMYEIVTSSDRVVTF